MAAPVNRYIPTVILEKTLSYLPLDDLANAQDVSHSWRTAASQERLWKALIPSGQQRVKSETALLNRVRAYLETVQLNQEARIECYFLNETKQRIVATLMVPAATAAAVPPLAPLRCRIVTRLPEEALLPWPSQQHADLPPLKRAMMGSFRDHEHGRFLANANSPGIMEPPCRASCRMAGEIWHMMGIRRDALAAQAWRPLYKRLVSIGTAAAIVASLAATYKYFRD